MMTILISVLICVIFAIVKTYKEGNYFDEYFPNCGAAIIIGLVVGLIVVFILPMKKYNKQYSYNIENLQDNSGINGSFFLGCGQIEGNMKYVFYYEENGLFKMEQLDVYKVQIKYSDGKPKVNVTEIYPTDDLINDFALDWDLFDKTYIIEVPKGSIKQNFNLDAQ